jgi:hypothetical protein
MLTTVARTATDSRAQQQDRIDAIDKDLKAHQLSSALNESKTQAELRSE